MKVEVSNNYPDFCSCMSLAALFGSWEFFSKGWLMAFVLRKVVILTALEQAMMATRIHP
jgi:hypothetical protein